MFWTLALILFLLWVLGIVVFHGLGGFVHILLILALAALFFQLLRPNWRN